MNAEYKLNGKALCAYAWAKEPENIHGLSGTTIRRRVQKNKLSISEALSRPKTAYNDRYTHCQLRTCQACGRPFQTAKTGERVLCHRCDKDKNITKKGTERHDYTGPDFYPRLRRMAIEWGVEE